jgi:tRNA(Arg) A34 adenosine deaminase TadA
MYALAMRVAEDSDCNDRHGVVLAAKDRVHAVAVNRQEPDRAVPDGHAEMRVIPRYDYEMRFWLDEGRTSTLYSARDADFTLSKPCESCQAAMRKAGIVRCVYSDGWQLQELKT